MAKIVTRRPAGILGDGALSRAGRKGATKVFKHRVSEDDLPVTGRFALKSIVSPYVSRLSHRSWSF